MSRLKSRVLDRLWAISQQYIDSRYIYRYIARESYTRVSCRSLCRVSSHSLPHFLVASENYACWVNFFVIVCLFLPTNDLLMERWGNRSMLRACRDATLPETYVGKRVLQETHPSFFLYLSFCLSTLRRILLCLTMRFKALHLMSYQETFRDYLIKLKCQLLYSYSPLSPYCEWVSDIY